MDATNSSSKRVVIAVLLGLVLIVKGTPIQALVRGLGRGYGTPGFGGGAQVGGLLGKTDLSDKPDIQVRGYLSHGLNDKLSAELGAGYASLKGRDYQTNLGLVDLHFVFTPVQFNRGSPFLFAGAGAVRYQLHKTPLTRTPGAKRIGWSETIPIGGGFKVKLSERASLDLSGGYTRTFSDVLDASALKAGKDGYWGIGVGLDFHESP